jgi:hypothetical protein
MSVVWNDIRLALPPTPLTAKDVGKQFVRRFTEHSCTECKSHFPPEMSIAKIKEVAVRLQQIEKETLYFKRVDGTRFTHHNDGGWIPLKKLWEFVPELGFSPKRIDPVSGMGEMLRYTFNIRQKLTVQDIGKRVVRSQPSSYFSLSWGFIPDDEKLEDNDERPQLVGISEKGVRIICSLGLQSCERIFPNDDHWITEDFFREYLDQHPDAVTPVKFHLIGECMIS